MGGHADFIPDSLNVKVVQLGSGDAAKPSAESQARLDKIWALLPELRTFPNCVEKLFLPSFNSLKDAAVVRPLAMLPPLSKTSTSTGTNVSSRTRNKVALELSESISKTPDQKKGRMPPNLKDIIDLSILQPASPPKLEKKEVLPVTLPTEVKVKPHPASKKRKVEQPEVEKDPEVGDIAIGAGLIEDFAKERQNKRLRHRSADLSRSGLGQAYESFKTLVASAYVYDKDVEKIEFDYQTMKEKQAEAVQAMKEKEEQISDLTTRAMDSEARVTDLSAEVDSLHHQLEEAKENLQHTARYCMLLGRINAMNEPEEARAAWNVKAVEEQLAGMMEEQGAVSFKAADQSPTPDLTPFSNQTSPVPTSAANLGT